MGLFQILPTETKFYDWFEQGAQNLVAAATLLCTMLDDGRDWAGRLAQMTELEHQGDFISHTIYDLLNQTFVTPLDPPEIQALTGTMDDVVDFIHAAADALLLYRVEQPRPYARDMAMTILAATKEIALAISMLRHKKQLRDILPHVQEINRLENEADRIGRLAIAELVDHRDEVFEFIRWKEIYEQLEEANDRCEDVADVLRTVVIKYA